MAMSGSYIEELQNELKQTDPNSHANRLVTQELDRLTKGEDRQEEKKERPTAQTIEVHHDRPQKYTVKVRIPVKEHPKYNFVGKLLGPKGQTLKALQEQTGCKMAIMGRGSMRDKDKEEEFRKQGGKYAHLNEDLHVSLECFTSGLDGQHRMAAAVTELKNYLIPELNDEMYGAGDMGGDMGMNGGAPRGRGGFRGAPPERGRGTFRGRGNGHAPPPPAARYPEPLVSDMTVSQYRGGPAGRGGPPPRGGPRGGPAAGRGGPGGPASRGGPAARGAPAAARGGRAPAPAPSYDAYGTQQSYSGGGYSTGYDNSYDESYGQDGSYYDYGQTGTASTGYDSYSSGGYGEYSEYNEGWGASAATGGAGVGKAPAAPTRGTARGPSRAHPYSRPGPATSGY